ncbi:T9SS type B sorting domain-containing protein [Aureivirga marina]|uniref:T9SS type B sorting domain-containing protein n=1 Tax=Aureivirga marina TaxID=1182451 RepID=UPI0018C98039|nr:T9SS type B sorting domain-containing protein [Aureivirga marina]
MNKKKLILLLFFISFSINAQNSNNVNIWYFGEKSGIDFNSGQAVAIDNGSLHAKEGSASICDADGNLLFYTDGIRVYNKNHDFMENGINLFGHPSSTTSAIIIPKPSSENLYYIFTCDALEDQGENGLNYSIVDLSLNNGLGAITEKNVLLHKPATEKLTAIYDESTDSFWVVNQELETEKTICYKVTSEGVSETPVINNLELISGNHNVGQMKFSPNGKKIAMNIFGSRVLLYDFNIETGIISNPIIVRNNNEEYYGLEFSPDSKMLYVSIFSPARLIQFDISEHNAALIQDSQYFLPYAYETIGLIQLAPDRKIYCVVPDTDILSVINSPNESGELCEFESNGFQLLNPNILGLPTYIQSTLKLPLLEVTDLCLGSETLFQIPEFDGVIENIHWDFGDGTSSTEINATHIYQEPGKYTVTATFETTESEDFIKTIEIEIYEQALISEILPFVMCNKGTVFIGESSSFDIELNNQKLEDFNYSFYETEEDALLGENKLDATFYFSTSDKEYIYARIEHKKNFKCFTIEKIPFHYAEEIDFTIEDQLICEEFEEIYLEAPQGFDHYLWSDGKTTYYNTFNQVGEYSLTIWNDGEITCEVTKNFTINYAPKAVVKNIEIKEWSYDKNVIKVNLENEENGFFEYSLDNYNFQTENIFKNLKYGNYTIFIKNENNCIIEKEVVLLDYPKYFSPNNDGIHDYWNIHNVENSKKSKIYIFDRFGKIITEVYTRGKGWNGKKNGLNLPASDYWFLFIKENGEEYRGHFTLKR